MGKALNPVSFCGVQWAKLGQKKLRVALPPPLPFVLTRDGCKDLSLTPSKKVPLDRPVPLLFLAYPESSLLRTCMPACLTAVAFRTQRLPSSYLRQAQLFVCTGWRFLSTAQRGHRTLRDVGSFDGCPFVAQTRTHGSAVRLGGRIGQSLAILNHPGIPTETTWADVLHHDF